MNQSLIPFQTIDWSSIPKTTHPGETGMAYWQTLQLKGLRLRIEKGIYGLRQVKKN